MTNFVVGFMFTPDENKVALIQKNRPAWQKGLLNGIGGKIEPFDVSEKAAICREFEEEAGVKTHPEDWFQFATLNVIGVGPVHVFKAVSDNVQHVENKTDEEINLYDTQNLPSNIIPNLKWLIPLSLDKNLCFEEPLMLNEQAQQKIA